MNDYGNCRDHDKDCVPLVFYVLEVVTDPNLNGMNSVFFFKRDPIQNSVESWILDWEDV